MNLINGTKYLRNTRTGAVYPYEPRTARLDYIETFVHGEGKVANASRVASKIEVDASDIPVDKPEPPKAAAQAPKASAASLPKLNPVEVQQ